MDKIKAIIEEAQEEGLLWCGGYYYYDNDGKNQGYSSLKIKKVTEILTKIKTECKNINKKK